MAFTPDRVVIKYITPGGAAVYTEVAKTAVKATIDTLRGQGHNITTMEAFESVPLTVELVLSVTLDGEAL